jgi:hypothetical protein
MSSKKIRKQDKSVSTFVSGWSEVIQNLPKSTYIDNKKAIATPTNDEIIKKYIFFPSNNKEHFEDLRENMLRALEYRDSLSRADERAKVQSGGLTEAGQSLYDRRKDIEAHTANQIFAELKAAAWQQIEPDKLKQFYKEFSEAKDEKAALEIAQKFSIVGFSRKKFDAIKKKYGVD